ncbi:TlyA family RNA methyltransferase [Microbacterium sp. RD1]|uniref:TlyA family RNA methyltransferase n=1 Tax=Microbacterium sp. RD1 TaxID=3457313 RepID=UPI003FA5F4DC
MTPRLDAALAARGLARSRTHASRLIADGRVSVDGTPVIKPATAVSEGAQIEVSGDDAYVSRGAHKLIAALDGFGIEVAGRPALDLGASTGGFTQVLRERGATPVLAVDVGHAQLSPLVAADPDVIAVEGYNVRYMDAANLAAATGVATAPQVITADLSFISLTHVLPALAGVADADADVVLLVKPQFEVGRTAVRGGLVTDPDVRADAVSGVLWSAWDTGLRTVGILPSPILGTHGNREFLVHLSALRGADPSEWSSTVNEVAGTR